jgi:hypothetical protein
MQEKRKIVNDTDGERDRKIKTTYRVEKWVDDLPHSAKRPGGVDNEGAMQALGEVLGKNLDRLLGDA